MGVQAPPTSRSHLKVRDTPSAVAEAKDRHNTLNPFILVLNVGINSSSLSSYGELVFLITTSKNCSFRSFGASHFLPEGIFEKPKKCRLSEVSNTFNSNAT